MKQLNDILKYLKNDDYDETCTLHIAMIKELEGVLNELSNLSECLKKVYDLIDMLDDGGYFDDKKNETSKKRNEIDLFQLGNFIESIKIKEDDIK